MAWAVVAVLALALSRLLLLLKPVKLSRGDEDTYKGIAGLVSTKGLSGFRVMAEVFSETDNPNMYTKSPPGRVVYLWLAARLLPRFGGSARALAWLSSAAAVLVVVLAAAVGWRLGGPQAAVASAALVGSAPLLLGLGRRALLDVPAAAAQLAVVAAATLGAPWWPLVSAAVVVALLTRESVRSALGGLAVAVAWLWGWDWEATGIAFGAALPAYSALLWVVTRRWPWQFPTAFGDRVVKPLLGRPGRAPPPGHYAVLFCRGGLHRLVVDLGLVSPAVVMAALVCCPDHGLVVAAAAVLVGYSAPWLDQQIRSCMAADLLVRLAVSLVVPWWAVVALVAVDLYIYWRVWWSTWGADGKQMYDPTTTNLGRALGMVGP